MKNFLITHFGIDNAIVSPFNTFGASVNRHFLVRYENNKYVLRNIRTATSIRSRNKIYHTICHWQKAGIPVALPVLTKRGDHSICCESEVWQLIPYLPGTPYAFAIHEMTNTANILRILHEATDESISSAGWFAQEICKLETEIPELNKWYPPLALLLQEQLPWLREFKDISLPPLISTHGDIHGLNILFENGMVSALIDFDNVELRPRLYDLAQAIIMFCRLERGSYTMRSSWPQKFLEIYGGDVTREEIEILPAMMFFSKIPTKSLFEELNAFGFNAEERAKYYWNVLNRISQQANAIF